jgi:putative ABC transport system substrate-binding protein
MRRRDFIAGMGSAVAALPTTAVAQQPAVPVIGYLSLGSPDVYAERLRAFRQSLQDAGFVE